jgi:hypothetical protein
MPTVNFKISAVQRDYYLDRLDALIAQAQRLRERLATEDYGPSPVGSSPAVIEPMEGLVDAATSLLRTLKGDQGSWEY